MFEVDELYLLPVKGSNTQWYQNVLKNPSMRIGAGNASGEVSAVAVTAGIGKNVKYEKGVMVLTLAEGGLMYEASVGGQKFKYNEY